MTQERTCKTASTVGQDSQPISLLDLPAEIWSKIGKLAIDDAPIFTGGILGAMAPQTTRDSTLNRAHKSRLDARQFAQPPIACACNALRDELLPYYYATKVDILIDDAKFRFENVGQWLRAIGPANRRNVRGLSVEMYSNHTYVITCDWSWVEGVSRMDYDWRGNKDKATFMREVEREWQVEVTLDLEGESSSGEVYRIIMGQNICQVVWLGE